MSLKSAVLILVILFLFVEVENGFAISFSEVNNSKEYFKEAKPIWPVGKELEKNFSIRLQSSFEVNNASNIKLAITGSCLYRIYLNNEFLGHGPARAAHGFYRVDEIDISNKVKEGTNQLNIEIAGYNANSYYLLDQPSFVQAEVTDGSRILVATKRGTGDIKITQITERIQKVPRYSFQRPFIEVYNLNSKIAPAKNNLVCDEVDPKQLIDRRIEFANFDVKKPVNLLVSGKVKTGQKQIRYWKDRAVVNISDKLGGFPESELVTNPAIELQEIKEESRVENSIPYLGSKKLSFNENSFQILDFGLNNTGFIGAEINCTKPCKVYITFDEILVDNDVDFKRLDCINSVTYNLEPGKYSVESFEPYTFRYMKIIVVNGECEIENIYLREYANPETVRATFTCSDERLNRIYTAGVESFKQNVVDIFMDCPSRERAGWLCDSFFSSRVASTLSGNTTVEKNFLENFLLPDSFEFLPDGMLPMCYPADHNDGVFIPNWAMWFVIQLQEYLHRSNDRQMVDQLKPKVLKLLQYFEPFINSDGLLESLDSWIFVEWSRANSFVQDVNYPTNMLYSATLEAAAILYDLPELQQQADKIRKVIHRQSYNGDFFVDNALRKKDGTLKVTENTTEVCQYYAFFFGIASPETHPELWKKLLTQFGPKRKNTNAYKSVFPANAFVGNYLRLELLSKYKQNNQILDESIGFFDYMAQRTGTLWENISTSASCNHGFASHVVHLFYRDVLGIHNINVTKKKVTVRFSDIEISSCKGQIPVGDERVQLEWERSNKIIKYKLDIPDGYTVEVKNLTDLILVEN